MDRYKDTFFQEPSRPRPRTSTPGFGLERLSMDRYRDSRMTGGSQVEKTLAEQVADLLQRKPLNYDVTFSVGPQKIQVQAVKILLKAASPVFEREFEKNWENSVMKEGEGIPLPKIDPTVFQLFVKLIISDTWSYEALTNLNLAPSTLLSLLGLCRDYKITKAINNLEKAASDFIQNFNTFKDTPEFLKMPQKNLKSILSCEEIPMDEKQIFECACRWAGHQCQQHRLEPTGENLREALGSCFYEIRFPTMELNGYTKISTFKKNLFTAEEKVAIFEYIGLDGREKAKFDKTQLPFKTNPRKFAASNAPERRLPTPEDDFYERPFVSKYPPLPPVNLSAQPRRSNFL